MKRTLIVFGLGATLTLATIYIFCNGVNRRQPGAGHVQLVVTQDGKLAVVPPRNDQVSILMHTDKRATNTPAAPAQQK